MSKIKKVFKDSPGSRIYFCSDFHYNHFNVIKHSGRPFQTLEEMNQEIITWLETLREDDVVFDLGDLFWNTTVDKACEVLGHCKASVYKIIGNHDKGDLWLKNTKLKDRVMGIFDLLDIRVENEKEETFMLTLSHYPICSWNHKPYGSLNIHGHCHGSYDKVNINSKELRLDIGWDSGISKLHGTPFISWAMIEDYFKNLIGINTEEDLNMTLLYNHVKNNRLKL